MGRDLTESAEYWKSKVRKELRIQLWYEQGGWCAHCDYWVDQDASTLDHLVSRKYGGPDLWGNCVMSCESCNLLKADSIPTYINSYALARMLKEYKKNRSSPPPHNKKPRRSRRKPVRKNPNSEFFSWLDSNPTPVRTT